MRFGWDYIMLRKGLLALLIFYMIFNFLSGVIGPLLVPLILDNWDASTLGYLSTLMGVGMLVGTLVMSAWGGGKRKIFAMLGAFMLDGLFLMAVCLRVSIPLLAVCGFGAMFCGPITIAASQAIWQAKVAPEVQGRVFAFRRTIAMSASNRRAAIGGAPGRLRLQAGHGSGRRAGACAGSHYWCWGRAGHRCAD